MIYSKIKTFIKKNKIQLFYLLIHRTFLGKYIKKVQIKLNQNLVSKRAEKIKDGQLNIEESKILQQLQTNGYAVVTDLFQDQDLHLLEELALTLEQESKQKSKDENHKGFWERLSDLNGNYHDPQNPQNIFALNESVLKVLNQYFKMPAFLEYTLITKSIFSGLKYKISQLWHLDKDDHIMAKLFIYLNDVNEGNGPFTMIDKNNSLKVPEFFLRNHIEDSFIEKYVPQASIQKLTGKKFSVFIVDTSKCLHMGSRIVDENGVRLMLTSAYITLPTIYPWQGKEKFTCLDNLSTIQKLAIRKLI